MLRNILLVGAGGALGCVARYLLTLLFARFALWGEAAVLAANVAGSLLIGVVASAACGGVSLFAAVGFCGGFTTFSTFAAQTLALLQAGRLFAAVAYASVSVVASVAAVFVGFYCGGRLFR